MRSLKGAAMSDHEQVELSEDCIFSFGVDALLGAQQHSGGLNTHPGLHEVKGGWKIQAYRSMDLARCPHPVVGIQVSPKSAHADAAVIRLATHLDRNQAILCLTTADMRSLGASLIRAANAIDRR